MRTLSQLYKILLHRIKDTSNSGICSVIAQISNDYEIDVEEYYKLYEDFLVNKPTLYNKWSEYYYERSDNYWWDKFSKEPRIKYLKARIADLEGRGE